MSVAPEYPVANKVSVVQVHTRSVSEAFLLSLLFSFANVVLAVPAEVVLNIYNPQTSCLLHHQINDMQLLL